VRRAKEVRLCVLINNETSGKAIRQSAERTEGGGGVSHPPRCHRTRAGTGDGPASLLAVVFVSEGFLRAWREEGDRERGGGDLRSFLAGGSSGRGAEEDWQNRRAALCFLCCDGSSDWGAEMSREARAEEDGDHSSKVSSRI
jgi:hypothetical protein